ncbi:hypothetical protein [Vibrio parahaemolyticus]|uniref:hypothetical protein n=1 Tax=Vibrio parahaemolyticus TaxID=670 RepID=UPI0009F012E0|nr:hypothetical protein [Vibrio parahaemolyticus]EGR2186159.1 hypothetical protein [Vibrio parahaemolyticus]EJG0622618.1 hypothetical protein [Vibrio parahaemolyticus]EJG0640870.1 hypothetical protein [Vibrio parahaemolyticus]EJG0730834.1 hypothetical protein [Vibrio parahaemolyticus]EJG0795887.1 hypothetical protein [Vibrio parahaemolyticus]
MKEKLLTILKATWKKIKTLDRALIVAIIAVLVPYFTWMEDSSSNDKKDAYEIYSQYLKYRNDCENKNLCSGLDDITLVSAERIHLLFSDDQGWNETIRYMYKYEPAYFTEMECRTLSLDFLNYLRKIKVPFTCKQQN